MAIKIYADAGSNLFKKILAFKHVDIKIVTMTVNVAGKEFRCYEDDIDVDAYSKEFYDKLKDGSDVKTSLPNPNTWFQAFYDDLEAGHQIICFTMASGISGTYNSARLAAEMAEEEFGEGCIHIIDSKTASFGEGLQALHAYNLVRKGKSFSEIIEECEKEVNKIKSEFTVGDVKYLVKTGRVSALVAKIASALNIKPILKGSKEATIVMARKVIGKMKALKNLADNCIASITSKEETVVYIAHSDNLEDANILRNFLEKAGIKKIETYAYDLVTGAHVGPGTVAIFYESKDEE